MRAMPKNLPDESVSTFDELIFLTDFALTARFQKMRNCGYGIYGTDTPARTGDPQIHNLVL